MSFDLLTTVQEGGCSSKLAAGALASVLAAIPRREDPALLVDQSTRDDAAVYRLDESTALIQTVDFFPPVCSDPRQFGRIAAANAVSDVFAMGGRVLTALNIVGFAASRIPIEVLGEILAGGAEKVHEAGGLVVGGHTIDDWPPKYGLAVTGLVHPSRVVTNSGLRPGDTLVLSKAIGTGTLVAGRRVGLADPAHVARAYASMEQLNRVGADVMAALDVRAGTDVTGFGLLGHAMQMADASGVTLAIDSARVPLLPGALDLAAEGCLPGGMFRNLDYVGAATRFEATVRYERKMLLCDPQTSGGLLFGVTATRASEAITRLTDGGYEPAIIGEVVTRGAHSIVVR